MRNFHRSLIQTRPRDFEDYSEGRARQLRFRVAPPDRWWPIKNLPLFLMYRESSSMDIRELFYRARLSYCSVHFDIGADYERCVWFQGSRLARWIILSDFSQLLSIYLSFVAQRSPRSHFAKDTRSYFGRTFLSRLKTTEETPSIPFYFQNTTRGFIKLRDLFPERPVRAHRAESSAFIDFHPLGRIQMSPVTNQHEFTDKEEKKVGVGFLE